MMLTFESLISHILKRERLEN